MRPFVEIGFMPSLMASGTQTWSHYRANVTPPKKWSDWSDLIVAFMQHLIDRYGLDEVLTWNFEVWNEPNCCPHDFWTGSQVSSRSNSKFRDRVQRLTPSLDRLF
jgi:xylan 1,4-beta-xylosidase